MTVSLRFPQHKIPRNRETQATDEHIAHDVLSARHQIPNTTAIPNTTTISNKASSSLIFQNKTLVVEPRLARRTMGPPSVKGPHGLMWKMVSSSRYLAGTTSRMTLSMIWLRMSTSEMSFECWVDTTIVCTRLGTVAPLRKAYSHVTCTALRPKPCQFTTRSKTLGGNLFIYRETFITISRKSKYRGMQS